MMGSKDPAKAVGRGESKIVLNMKVAESEDLHRLRPLSPPEPQRRVPRFPPDPRAPAACDDGACCEGAPTIGEDRKVHLDVTVTGPEGQMPLGELPGAPRLDVRAEETAAETALPDELLGDFEEMIDRLVPIFGEAEASEAAGNEPPAYFNIGMDDADRWAVVEHYSGVEISGVTEADCAAGWVRRLVTDADGRAVRTADGKSPVQVLKGDFRIVAVEELEKRRAQQSPLVITELAWVSLGQGHSLVTAHLNDGRRATLPVRPERRVWWLSHLLAVFFGGAG